MSRTIYSAEIAAAAAAHGLSASLVEAQVLVESNGNAWAWNPEPRYRYFWNMRSQRPFRAITPAEQLSEFPPADFPCLADDADQEWWGQQASWGIQQLMGALAREYGFRGPYLTQLCDVATNLDIGCAHLSRLLAWAKGDVDQALSAYNGGQLGNVQRPFRNQAYADRVRALVIETHDVNLSPEH